MAWYRVKFEYKAVEPTELTVPAQAVVRILSSEHPEWWLADWNGVQVLYMSISCSTVCIMP